MKAIEISKNIFTVDSFLNSNECSHYINQAETIGFDIADVNTGTARKHLAHIRNNERVDLKSEQLADEIWLKVEQLKLPSIEGKHPVGLSPYFRFYKYSPGQKFSIHKDGRQRVGEDTTFLTLLVYLNDDFTGGSTSFRQDNTVISPRLGTALIFEHRLWHKGDKLESGLKYVLRTDVTYR